MSCPSSSSSQNRLTISFAGAEAHFIVNEIGGLIPVAPTATGGAEPASALFALAADSIDEVTRAYFDGLAAIAQAIDWQGSSPLSAQKEATTLTDWLKRKPEALAAITEMKLAHCNLSAIPPQIQFFYALEKLDLSDNNSLRMLPPELQFLQLKELDISGNISMQSNIPDWLGSMEGMILIAYRMGLCMLPPGFTPERVKTERNLQPREDEFDICYGYSISSDEV
jgi:Leucine-rich repeat (LRR) protein